MASTYKHGVYVQEEATAVIAPIEGTAGLQVVIGTAPVNMLEKPEEAVNTPIIAYSYKEAVSSVGYSSDFANYTLCESISANANVVNTAPIILINVLSPTKHTSALDSVEVLVEDGLAVIEQTGVLLSTLSVQSEGVELTVDEDYTTLWGDDGGLQILIVPGGSADGATALTVSGKYLDPSKVTWEDIVGGVDVNTGAETGMEVIRQVYPKLGLTPGIITAPRWSKNANVAAALQAKCVEINGSFKAVCIIDIDSSASGAQKYTDVKEQKEKQAVSSENALAVWLYGKIGDTIYSGSTLASALTAYTDANNGDVPYISPSNEPINISASCLEDGTEVLLDQDQGNLLNGQGVTTFLNMNGFRLWGNNTAAYPGTTDPKDRWFCVRRFLSWRANSFILTYFQKVDDPLSPRLRDAVIESENLVGHGLVANGYCAGYTIEYDADSSSPIDGVIAFRQAITPWPPAEVIQTTMYLDTDAWTSALEG